MMITTWLLIVEALDIGTARIFSFILCTKFFFYYHFEDLYCFNHFKDLNATQLFHSK